MVLRGLSSMVMGSIVFTTTQVGGLFQRRILRLCYHTTKPTLTIRVTYDHA